MNQEEVKSNFGLFRIVCRDKSRNENRTTIFSVLFVVINTEIKD